MLNIAATCLVITALLSRLNHRFVRLPMTIGVMVIALSLAVLALDAVGWVHALLRYEESLLLFAGALHVDLSELKAQRWPVMALALALLGTVLSTLLVGFEHRARGARDRAGGRFGQYRLSRTSCRRLVDSR